MDRIGPGGQVIPATAVAAQNARNAQERIDELIDRSAGVYGLEQIRELGTVPRD